MTAQETTSVRTVCPYCGVGCGMLLDVKDGRVVKVSGDKQHPANFGRLCTKGQTVGATLNTPDRLAHAHLRNLRSENVAPVALEEAIEAVAKRLTSTIKLHGPDSVAFYVSGQLSMEAQYLINKLSKGFVRTNNIDSNSRLCMSSAASGYKLSLGADGPPGSYQDFDNADCFFVIGSNMAECHPILFLRLLDRKRDSGAKLIVVDPRRTPTAEKADLYLPIEPGTDLALLNGLLYLLKANGHVDHEFIAKHTEGWADLSEFLEAYPPQAVAEITGLDESAIRQAAQWIGESKEVMSLWTMGLNQSTHGTWHTNAICNLHLATGKICRAGSGPFSLTGQPNAMGGREMGYMSHTLPGQRSVTSHEDRSFIEEAWHLPPGAIRPEPGADAVSMFQKLESGEIKTIWIMATNPVASMPKRSRVIHALERAECVIVHDAYHPTETSRYADILLPGAVWAEADGTMVNSERTVTLMQKAVEPPGDAKPDWQIITLVARAMGYGEAFPYQSAAEVFDEIRTLANPHTGYDLRGISHERLRSEPIQWPCVSPVESGKSIRYISRLPDDPESSAARQPGIQFPTDSGKARLLARPHLPPAELPNQDYPFILTTGRTAHQWHTMTKTGKVPALNRLNSAPFVEVNAEDAAVLDLNEQAVVEVASVRGRAVYPVRITDKIRPGCCFAPIHWNDMFGENLSINAATSEAVDPFSKQPEFKFCAVRLTKVSRPAKAGIEEAFGPDAEIIFTQAQQAYIQKFFADSVASAFALSGSGFSLPVDAPFTTAQRDWLGRALTDSVRKKGEGRPS
jgi:sulfite reductase (NADPH) flavoprotein alpha-component